MSINPFLHNAWMMMGRSQYNNGDFLGAAATFYYITRHFSWLPATVTEARIWQARSYLSMGWDFEAENILEKIPEKELEANSQLRNLYNLVQSAYWSRSANPSKAIPYLEQSARSAKGDSEVALEFHAGTTVPARGAKSQGLRSLPQALFDSKFAISYTNQCTYTPER